MEKYGHKSGRRFYLKSFMLLKPRINMKLNGKARGNVVNSIRSTDSLSKMGYNTKNAIILAVPEV